MHRSVDMKQWGGKYTIPKVLLWFLVCIAFPGFSLPVGAQDVGTLEMVCTVKEDGEGLSNAKVTVYQDGIQFLTKNTNDKGRAVFKLPYLHRYRIEFSKESYVTKFIEVDTKIPEKEAEISSSFKFDVRIFPYYEGLDLTPLKKPVAILNFDGGFGDFYYDMQYHKEVKDGLKAVEDHALALIERAMAGYLIENPHQWFIPCPPSM